MYTMCGGKAWKTKASLRGGDKRSLPLCNALWRDAAMVYVFPPDTSPFRSLFRCLAGKASYLPGMATSNSTLLVVILLLFVGCYRSSFLAGFHHAVSVQSGANTGEQNVP